MKEPKKAQIKSNSERVASYKENLGKTKKVKASVKFLVKEKTGKWGEWTGQFNLKKNEKLEDLISRAKEHFKEKFDNDEYRGKEFAMLIVEEVKTREIIPNFSL